MVANEPSTSYTQFMDQAKEGKIKRVDVQGRTLTVTPTEGAAYKITAPGDLWMVEDLRKAGVQVYGYSEYGIESSKIKKEPEKKVLLGYACMTEEEIEKAMRKLKEVWE